MLLAYDYSDSLSFDEIRQVVANESFAGAASITQLFSNLIPKAASIISDTAVGFTQKTVDEVTVIQLKNKVHSRIVEQTKNLPYVTYKDMIIMVPEGFRGNLLSYLKTIMPLRRSMVARTEQIMGDYRDQLSMFLTNKAERETMDDYSLRTKKIAKERDSIEGEIRRHFNDRDTKSRVRLGQVISRFSELPEIFRAAEELNQLRTNSDLSKLTSLTTEINDVFGLIKKRLDDGTIEEISGQSAKNISEGAYQTAKFMELTSIVIFNTEVMSTVISGLATQFEKVVLSK